MQTIISERIVKRSLIIVYLFFIALFYKPKVLEYLIIYREDLVFENMLDLNCSVNGVYEERKTV